MIEHDDEKSLAWYCCQTDFERSTFGTMLEITENYADGVRRYLDERNRWIRKMRAEQQASRAGLPWDPEPITAYPRRETREPGGNLPSDTAYELKAYIETRLLTMERMGRLRDSVVLQLTHDPIGGYFADRGLPRHYALLLYTEPGLKFLNKAYRALKLTAVGARLEKDQQVVPVCELGERALEHHEQMALHGKRIDGGEYGATRELFAEAALLTLGMYEKAVVSWTAAGKPGAADAARAAPVRAPLTKPVFQQAPQVARAYGIAGQPPQIPNPPPPPLPTPRPKRAPSDPPMLVSCIRQKQHKCGDCGAQAIVQCCYALRGAKVGQVCGKWLCPACAWEAGQPAGLAASVYYCGAHARVGERA